MAAVGVLALALGGLLCRSELQRRTRWLALALVAAWAVGAALAALGQGRAGLPLQALAFAWSAALLAWLPRREAGSRAEIARLRAIAEARAERVSVLSHEVRTPLAMIKAAADLLLEGKPGPLTPQQATFLETISQNCERTIGLAEDLLTQARIEAGLFKVNLQPVDLCGLVRQLARGLRPLLERQGQIMVLDCPQVMPRIQADPRLIQQALTNLLHNASRYTSPGGHIYVNISDNGHTVVDAVTDDGGHVGRGAAPALPALFVEPPTRRRHRPGAPDRQADRRAARRAHHGRHQPGPGHDLPLYPAPAHGRRGR